jgi:hypothetical protein
MDGFQQRLEAATSHALRRCQQELTPEIVVQFSLVKKPEASWVTFMLPGNKKQRPVILFSCIAGVATVARPRMAGDGFFGAVKRHYEVDQAHGLVGRARGDQ